MKTKPYQLYLMSLLVVLLMLSACSPTAGPQVQPTTDPQVVAQTADALKTEIAATIVSGLTATALAAPTNTPEPTATTEPTSTTAPSPTTAAASITPPPTVAVITLAPTRVVVLPTVTPTRGEYQCTVTKQSITPGMTISRSVDFDARWTVRNSGTKNWASGALDYSYSSGEELHTGNDAFDLNVAVDSGKTVDIIVDMEAPAEPGRYQATWVLTLDGQVMCYLPLDFRVQ